MNRDISADNVLVFNGGSIFKICDLGLISFNVHSELVAGKPHY